MLARRTVAAGLAAMLLHLTFAAPAAACSAVMAAGPPVSGAVPASAADGATHADMAPHGAAHHHDGTPHAMPEPASDRSPDAPTAPPCCASFTSCGPVLQPGDAAAGPFVSALVAVVHDTAPGAPASSIRAPEPPRPKA